MESVAIIPARGGSQRIPGKNIRAFNGLPMIAWSIRAALDSGCFDRVLVSTDSEEIAQVAREFGAETPFVRPVALSDAHTGTGSVMAHAVRWLQDAGISLQWVCCLYATAPFLQPEDLQAGLQALKEEPNRYYAFAVTSFAFPIQRALRRFPDGGTEPFFPEYVPCRSQDLEPAWHDAGQFYWARPEAYLESIPLFSEHAIALPLPRHRVLDIDTPEDWEHAELLHQAWRKSLQREVASP
ncbi:pseudaminic acid cytidylyltransferase [Mangrovitalea sediminis]|uniref:pseudaminic acid cytidylyltransferase n=1 Tax=Mangrovitalea sediminis TaxID=1982043 RepID=UPI000BE4D5F8|nr:pseudaminic acid cytidylyltransferase [Mangrovitalea sediminis]